MRKSTILFVVSCVALALLSLSALDARFRQQDAQRTLGPRTALVAELGLSDLALFTEARYTRHLSLADRHAPFQNNPVSFDHFPSASLVLPPGHLRR